MWRASGQHGAPPSSQRGRRKSAREGPEPRRMGRQAEHRAGSGGGRGLAWVLEQPEAAGVLSAFCKCRQVHLAHSGSHLSPPKHLSTTGAEWTSRQE